MATNFEQIYHIKLKNVPDSTLEYGTSKTTYITYQANPVNMTKDAIVFIFAHMRVLEVIYDI